MKTEEPQVIIPQLTVDKLDSIISDRSFQIIDVRDAKGIKTQGRIPGAINIPLEQVEAEIVQRHQNPDSIFNRDVSYLFCCTGGVMSYMGAICAVKHGLENVFNLEGGHAGWMKWKESNSALVTNEIQ